MMLEITSPIEVTGVGEEVYWSKELEQQRPLHFLRGGLPKFVV
jgi:hypothetical protein